MPALFVFVLLALATLSFGGLFRPDDWYVALEKPALTPPGWVFPPVWTVLYLMIAMSGWMVWQRRRENPHANMALLFWAGQLFFNGMWSWLFFGLHRPGLAFVEIVVLWSLIVGSLVSAWRVRPLAGALLAPYLAWVSFAGWLNGMIWYLNR